MQVKAKIATAVRENPSSALLPARKSVFDALVQTLEFKLSRRNVA